MLSFYKITSDQNRLSLFMNVQDYRPEQIAYKQTYNCPLSADEMTEAIKIQIRGNRKSLIFVLDKKPNLRGGGSEQEHTISPKLISRDVPSNYVLAVDNVNRYTQTAIKLSEHLKASFVPTSIKYNSTIGHGISEKLNGCNTLDQSLDNFQKFLIVTKELVLKCIDGQNLEPDEKIIYTSILLNFYSRANVIYNEEHQGAITTEGFSSIHTRSLVNSERILLTLRETGIHLNTYEKAFLSNVLKILDSQDRTIQDCRNNLESAERTWTKLVLSYKTLQEVSEQTLNTLQDNLVSATRTIASLTSSLHEEKGKSFFIRYWKVILYSLPFLVFLIISYLWLLNYVLKSRYNPPAVNVNFVQPARNEIKPENKLGEPVNAIDNLPTPLMPVPKVPKINQFKTYVFLGVQALTISLILQKKFIGLGGSEFLKLQSLENQEMAAAIHQRKLKLLRSDNSEIEKAEKSKGVDKEKDFFETVNKLRDDVINGGKVFLLAFVLSLLRKGR